MPLITEEYRALNRELLETNSSYAISGHSKREMVRELCNYGRKPVLDYGCGRKYLQKFLGPAYTVFNYDPAVPDCSDPPEPCEVVYCGDVLEHIEPECLDDVLADIRRVTSGVALLRICLVKSRNTLPDGRNPHLIVENADWWRERLIKAGFTIVKEKPPQETLEVTWFLVS